MLFRKQQPKVEIVLQKADLPITQDDAHAIASLQGQAGWEALLRRLSFQRQVLQARLNKPFHKDLREVDALQVGLQWLGYLEEECRRATNSLVQTKRIEPTSQELEEFRKIDAFIERVGSPQD